MIEIQTALGVRKRHMPTDEVPHRHWILSGLIPFGARWTFERVVCGKRGSEKYLRWLVKWVERLVAGELTAVTAWSGSNTLRAVARCAGSTRLSSRRSGRGRRRTGVSAPLPTPRRRERVVDMEFAQGARSIGRQNQQWLRRGVSTSQTDDSPDCIMNMKYNVDSHSACIYFYSFVSMRCWGVSTG